jgi:hypothetical protein
MKIKVIQPRKTVMQRNLYTKSAFQGKSGYCYLKKMQFNCQSREKRSYTLFQGYTRSFAVLRL